MSYADDARSALQTAVRQAYKPVWEAGADYSNAYLQAVKATDVVETMQRMVELIMSAEHLAEVAAEAEKSARAILAEQMNDTGATQIQTDFHTAYLSKKAAYVAVDQPDLVPGDYMCIPEPAPDKRAIKAAIEGGEEVPGCTIVRPNEVQLNIKLKHKKG